MSRHSASRPRSAGSSASSRPAPARGGARRPPAGGPAAQPRTPPAAIRIDQVQRALGEILQWTYPADAALSHWLRAHPALGARDRGPVAGVGPASRRLAILGLAATLGGPALRDGLDAAEAEWLQRVGHIDQAALPRAVRASMPDWLDERLGRLDDADALMAALNRPAPLDLRVNPLKAERDAVLAGLREGPAARFDPQPTPYSPWGIRLAGRPAVNRWPQFENGSLEVQVEGSQLLALLVGPRRGEMIIDFCAGAGGKTL